MRIVTALVYAIMAGLGAIVTAGQFPADPVAWCGLALAVISAGWGKFSADGNWILPNREVWTPERRMVEGKS